MKTLCTLAALVACTTAAQADAWTCSYTFSIKTVITRFVVTPPNLTDAKSGEVYRILEDNDYGLVAARGIAEIRKGDLGPTVAATTIIIFKKPDKTADFRYGTLTLGIGELTSTQSPTQGVCVRD